MNCLNCGAALKENAKFCAECGTKVMPPERHCISCGTVLGENAKFCPKCGTKQENISGESGGNNEKSASPVNAENVARAAKILLEHTSAASDSAGEMRISMNQVGGDKFISLIKGFLG